jgi:hypothetical protein
MACETRYNHEAATEGLRVHFLDPGPHCLSDLRNHGKTIRSALSNQEFLMLLTQLLDEMHQGADEGTEVGQRLAYLFHIAPVHLDAHVVVRPAVPCMANAVPPPTTGPVMAVPCRGSRVNFHELIDQFLLNHGCEGLDSNFDNAQHDCVEIVINFAAQKMPDMAVIRRSNTYPKLK